MKLLILGAGEYGKLVKELAQTKYSTVDFLDDNSDVAIGKLDDYKELFGRYRDAVVAVGNSEIRLAWLDKLEQAGYRLPTVVSDRAFVSPSAELGSGCIVEPMAVIHTGAAIGRGSIVSSGAVINHNVAVEPGCHIDCNAVVGADVTVPAGTHLQYGQILKKDD